MTPPMIPRERCDYSAIVDREPLRLPGGARVIFWTIVNYEVWDIARPMARQVLPAPTGVPLLPDVVHWAWHEYGMRVGCWRFFELFARLGLRPTLAANARICEDYPRVAEEARNNGWEFMGHAYDQIPIHKVEDQAAMINRSMDVIELNDIPMMIVQHHESDYLTRRAIDRFDRLYAEGKDRAKIVSLAIHPYISGQPHRIKYLEAIYDYVNRFEGVLHWNGAEILDWYLSVVDPAKMKAAE